MSEYSRSSGFPATERPALHPFEQFERLAVASALKKMAELRVDLQRKTLFQPLDSFRDDSESFGVPLRITPALFIANDGEAFAEGGGEGG